MTRRAFLCGMAASAAMCVMSVGCAVHHAPVTQPGNPTAVWYENQRASIRFCYPMSWHPVKGGATVTLVPLGESTVGSHRLTIDDPELPPHLPGFIPLGLVEAGFVADLRNRYNQLRVTSSVAYELDGVSARRLSAAGVSKNGPVVVNTVLCVRGDSVYVIDAETDAADAMRTREAFDMVVESLRWLN